MAIGLLKNCIRKIKEINTYVLFAQEIVVKAVSAILLLLLKHFKLSHVYQFEFISQHLVFANCIPLVLKFFNQNILAYISARNVIPIMDFPSCVIGDQPELNPETFDLEVGDNQVSTETWPPVSRDEDPLICGTLGTKHYSREVYFS